MSETLKNKICVLRENVALLARSTRKQEIVTKEFLENYKLYIYITIYIYIYI